MSNKDILDLCTEEEIRDIVNHLEHDHEYYLSINEDSDEHKALDTKDEYYVEGQKEYFAIKFVFKALVKSMGAIYDNTVNVNQIRQQFKKLNIAVYSHYYWVNQGKEYPENKEYIQAPYDNLEGHRLIKNIKENDKILSYISEQGGVFRILTAISRAEKFIKENDDRDWYRVRVSEELLPQPKSLQMLKNNRIDTSKLNRDNIPWNSDYKKSKQSRYLVDIGPKLYYDILGAENISNDNLSIPPEGDSDMQKEPKKQPLNQILYGPPGTGKTYNTVIKAMEIIDEKTYTDNKGNLQKDYDYHDLKEQYDAYKKRFDAYKEQGQIEFVTFHQSYSYEEFVEGIKPATDEDDWTNATDKLLYAGNDGIFKLICKKAEDSYVQDANNSYGLNKNPKIWKVSLKSTGDNDIRTDCMMNNRIRIGFDKYGEFISDETIFDGAGIRVVPAFINKMEIGDIVLSCYTEKTIDAIGVITSEYKWNNDFDEYKRYREVKWLAKDLNQDIVNINKGKKFTLSTIYQLKNIAIKDVLDIVNKPQHQKEYKGNYKPHVLIIDEINRGNISKIFGELITLIEPDKRKNVTGDDKEYHTLEVTLPYSKDPFYVPNNLYIIGTMNTSDRSIASIDIALRRRFKFVEMMPKSDKINEDIKVFGAKVRTVFEKLNERISVLLDRDHQIGHSYFMKLNNSKNPEDDFKDIWFDEIMPLLNEYFYGDWEKLQAILGEAKKDNSSFIKIIENVSFATKYTCDDEEKCDFNTKCDFAEAMKNAFSELYKEEKVHITQNEEDSGTRE